MAATQSLRRILSRKEIKTLVARGSTLDSSTLPATVTTTASKLKRIGVGARTRKLLTHRQNWTAA